MVMDRRPEWGAAADTGDGGSGEFTLILRGKPPPPAA